MRMFGCTTRVAAYMLLSSHLLMASLAADDWPQFLGTRRDGRSAETELTDTFPDGGPQIIWRHAVGIGMSNVSVSEGRVITLDQNNDAQYVVALSEKSGNELWKTRLSAPYKNAMGNGPRATPTIHKDQVFVFSGEGVLAAIDAASGKIQWHVDAVNDTGGKPAEYGMASSPLVVDNHVIVQTGGNKGTVAAYDAATGKRVWTAGQGAAGYSSPVLMNLCGRRQVVAFTAAGVMGIAPQDGQQLWHRQFRTEYDCNTACPVQVDDDRILISAGENHGSELLRIATVGSELQAEVVWSSLGRESVLRAEWQTPVKVGDHLFGFDNVGSAGPVTNIVCVRLSDGKQVWIRKRFGKGNMIFADGRFYATTMKGDLVIIDALADQFRELARASVLKGQTRQAPVIANGNLYLRDDREVVCIRIAR